jgi:hypothetical protein
MTNVDPSVLPDVVAMLKVAQSLCRQCGDVLMRSGYYGWSEEPYEWDGEIGEYLFILDDRLEK